MAKDQTIPTVDLSLLLKDRESVLSTLKHALVDHGFFYITNYQDCLDHDLIEALADQTERFFNLPVEEKNKIQMSNSKHFLGYNGLKKEITAGRIDWREQIDFCSTDAELPEYKHIYQNLIGSNQYPDEDKLPYFKKTIRYFLEGMDRFSIQLISLIFESLSIDESQYSPYFNTGPNARNFNKMKLIKYPPLKELKKCTPKEELSTQGCGPHKDSDFLTYLIDPSNVNALKVQDLYGDWIDVKPIPKSIIVNVGQTLEYLTSGVCLASIHKVTAPSDTARISIPFFQNVKVESVLKPFQIKDELIKERDLRDKERTQNVAFQFKPSLSKPIAVSVFKNRIKSHRDVSEKWYPEELAKIDAESAAERSKDNKPKEKNPELLTKVLRLTKIFKAFHSSLIMELMRYSGDVPLRSFVPKLKYSISDIKYGDLLRLFTIWPNFIAINLNNEGEVLINVGETDRIPKFSDLTFRNSEFEKRCEGWITNNENLEDIPPLQTTKIRPEVDLAALLRQAQQKKKILESKAKVTKPTNKNSKLSVLERIRLKEKERKENLVSPEFKREEYLDSKIPQALNILFTMHKRNQSITRLSEVIKTSLSSQSAISTEDAADLVKRLCLKYPNVFQYVNGKNIRVLKWKEFDLNELKRQLKAKKEDNKQ